MNRWQVRAWSLDDLEELYQLVRSSAPELSLWLPWCHANYSKQDAADWLNHCQRAWEGSIEYPMGVFDTATNSPVGGVGINKIDPTTRSANLGSGLERRGLTVALQSTLRERRLILLLAS